MIEPEEYDEFGEIVAKVKPKTYERQLTAYDQHRIHETKDLFDGDCNLCQKQAREREKQRQAWRRNSV